MMAAEATSEKPVDVSVTDASLVSLSYDSSIHLTLSSFDHVSTIARDLSFATIVCAAVPCRYAFGELY